jgi:rhodanese-related sulfurtransferase
MQTIQEAPRNSRRGYLEARPGDVIGRSELLLVDVRSKVELDDDLGHIEGVRHLPSETVQAQGLPGVSKDTPVVLVDNNGRTSADCAVRLMEQGYQEVYVLVGGMVRWNAEERPIAYGRTWIPMEPQG